MLWPDWPVPEVEIPLIAIPPPASARIVAAVPELVSQQWVSARVAGQGRLGIHRVHRAEVEDAAHARAGESGRGREHERRNGLCLSSRPSANAL